MAKPTAAHPFLQSSKLTSESRSILVSSVTDGDGRCGQLLTPGSTITAGIYKITFFTSEYFSKRGITSFYPFVEVSG